MRTYKPRLGVMLRLRSHRPLPRDSDAFGVDILGGDGLLQLVQLSSLLQLLYQAFDSLFAPFFLLAVLLSLLPAQQSLDNGGSERQNWHLELSLKSSQCRQVRRFGQTRGQTLVWRSSGWNPKRYFAKENEQLWRIKDLAGSSRSFGVSFAALRMRSSSSAANCVQRQSTALLCSSASEPSSCALLHKPRYSKAASVSLKSEPIFFPLFFFLKTIEIIETTMLGVFSQCFTPRALNLF